MKQVLDQSYDACSDEELVERSRRLDSDALTVIVTRYLPFIRRRARAMKAGGLEMDDLVQEGLIGLFQAVRRFDAGCGASFGGFAAACIVNRMVTAIRSQNSGKHLPLNSSVSIDDWPDAGLPSRYIQDAAAVPEEIVIMQEKMEAHLKRITSVLSQLELQAFQLYISGHNYQEMAHILHTSPKAVDNALQRVRKKLRSVYRDRQFPSQ